MNSTFLQPALFNKLVHTINKAYKPAKESNVPNKKLEIMRSKFKFISTFETKYEHIMSKRCSPRVGLFMNNWLKKSK